VRQYILHRLILNIPVVLIVVTLVFFTSHIRPDLAEQRAAQGQANTQDYQAAIKAIRQQLGTDKPLWRQYTNYLWDLAHVDLGRSFLPPNKPVLGEMMGRLPASMELGLLQILIAMVIAVPIGIIAAIRQDTWIDYILRIVTVLGVAVPSFYLGTLLLLFVTKILGWTPPLINTSYREIWESPAANLKMMLLPALAGGLAEAAVIMRLLRSEMLEVLRQDYVRTAWSKGLRERMIVMRHVLRNALAPVVTILGVLIGVLFGGNVVLETIFSVPGAGQFIVISLKQNDQPVVQGIVVIVAVALVTTNLIVDLTYAWLDPRIRYS
jgi:peptide/nickel transport system permease protein